MTELPPCKQLSKAVESEFGNINAHLNKTLRDNLTQITITTHESMGELKDIVDIIKNREDAISRLNAHFHNMQNAASDMLEKKQREIDVGMNQQLEKMLENFTALKNDINQHHDNLCGVVKNENSENHQRMSELLDAHDEKIAELSHNIHKRHEGLLEVFNDGNNIMHLRIQKVLKDLNTHHDQLVNRVESRQVQVKELMAENDNQFSNILNQHAEKYQHVTRTVTEFIEGKHDEFTDTVANKLDLFGDILQEVKTNHGLTADVLSEKFETTHHELEDKLQKVHDDNYQKIFSCFSEHKKWLENTVTTVETSRNELERSTNEYKNIFQKTVVDASKNSETLHRSVQNQLEQVISSVDRAAISVRDVTSTFGNACTQLETTNQRSEDILQKVGDNLITNTQLLSQTTEKLENCGDTLDSNLRKQAQKISEVVSYVEREQSQSFDNLIKNINERIQYLKENISTQNTAMGSQFIDIVDKQNKLINETLHKNVAMVNDFSTQFTEKLDKICHDMLLKFGSQTNDVEKSVVELLQKMVKSRQALDSSLQTIQNAVEGTDTRFEKLQKLSEQQTQFFENLLARIEKNSHTTKQSLQADQQELMQILAQAEEKALSSKNNILQDTGSFIEHTDKIAGRFLSIHDKFTQHLQIIGEVSATAQSNCVQMDESLRGQITQLQTAINSHNHSLSSAFNPTIEQIANVSAQIKNHTEEFYHKFNQSIDKVNEVSVDLTDKGNQIVSIFNTAENSIHKAEGKLLESAGKMGAVADNIENQAERLENMIRKQTQEVASSAKEFEARTHNLNGSLGRYLETVKENTDNFSSHFMKTGKEFTTVSKELKSNFASTMEEIGKHSADFESNLKRLMGGMLKTSEMIKNHSEKVSENEQSLSNFSESSSKSLTRIAERVNNLTNGFDKVSTKINENITRLNSSITDQKSGVIAVSSDLKDIRDDLMNQCREALEITERANRIFAKMPETLLESGDTHIDKIKQASQSESSPPNLQTRLMDNNNHNEETLIASPVSAYTFMQTPAKSDSETSSSEADNITLEDDTLSRDEMPPSLPPLPPLPSGQQDEHRAFIDETNRTVKELHQTTAQLANLIMNGKIDKTLQDKYSEGKVDIFTRQLLEIGERDFSKFMRRNRANLIVQDHIKNYRHKFENLLNNAYKIDEPKLPDNFNASDIGKLYHRICENSDPRWSSFDKTH